MSYLKPSEIIEQYPDVAKVWNQREIGYLLMLKLVRGKKLPRTCLVNVDDLLSLIKLKFK